MNTNKKIEIPQNTRARHGGSNPTRQPMSTRCFKITQKTRDTWVTQNMSQSTIIKSYKTRFKIVPLRNSKVNRKSKDKQYNSQRKRYSKANSEIQTLQRKLKIKQNKPHNKIDDELICSWRVGSSCSTKECLKHLRYTNFVYGWLIHLDDHKSFFYTIVLIKDHTGIKLSYKYLSHYALNDIISISIDFCFQQRKCFIMFKMETVCCGMVTFVREAHIVTPLATNQVIYVKR